MPDAPRSGQPRKVQKKGQAEIIALACSGPPEGRKRWTLELLVEEAKTIEGLEMINRESIRLILKKKRMQTLVEKNVVNYNHDEKLPWAYVSPAGLI